MAIRTSTQTRTLECGTAGQVVWFDVTNQVSATVQIVGQSGVLSDGVFTLKRSNDGYTGFGLEGVGVTIGPGAGMSDALDIAEIVYLGVECTTADSSESEVVITMHAVREE